MKLFNMFILSALLMSFCLDAVSQEVSPASNLDAPAPSSFIELVKSSFGVHRKVSFARLSGFSSLEIERLTHIAANVEKIINSSEITDLLSAHVVVPYKKEPVAFWDVNEPLKLTWRDAWAITMRSDWDMNYEGYRSWRSTVGYTYANVKWIKLNKSHSNFKHDHLIAQNFCHEFGGHKRGFRHASRNDIYRPYSYPYALGKICADLYVKQFKPWKK